MNIKKTPLLLLSGISLFFILGASSLLTENADLAKNNNDWPVSTPKAEKVDANIINAIHQDIQAGKYGLIDHFLLIRNGKVIADHHYQQDYESIMRQHDTTNHQYNYDHTAWHPYYQNTDLHTMQSVTKSVTALLVGIAVDEGYIKSVNLPAMSFFKSYKTGSTDPRRASMTVEDLLTMQSGIEWDEESYDEADNSCILMEASEDWIQFVLDNPMDRQPGEQFEYNSGASVLLGKIVREATGKRIDKWAEEKLFAPLGIKEYYWKITPKGEVDTEGGLYLSTHSLAKIGYLMMHDGQWNDQQIISKESAMQSLKPHVDFNGTQGYGYQWWVQEHQNGSTNVFAGNGYGGQFLVCAPAQDLLVVFNGWEIHNRPEQSTWTVFREKILPAAE